MLLLKEEEEEISLLSIVKCSAENVAEKIPRGNECGLFLYNKILGAPWAEF